MHFCTSHPYKWEEEIRIYDRAGVQFCGEQALWQGQGMGAGYCGTCQHARLAEQALTPVCGRPGLFRLRGWAACRFALKNGASVCTGEALLPIDVLLRLPECAPYELCLQCDLTAQGFFRCGCEVCVCVSGSCEVLALVRVPESCRPKTPPACPPPCKSPCRPEPPRGKHPPLCPPPWEKEPCLPPPCDDPCRPPMVCLPLYPPDFCRRC